MEDVIYAQNNEEYKRNEIVLRKELYTFSDIYTS